MISISEQNIDLGEIHYAPDQGTSSKTKILTIKNNNDYSIKIVIKHFKSPNPESPVCVTVHEVDEDLLKDTKALNRYFELTLGSPYDQNENNINNNNNLQYLILNAHETKIVVAVLTPVFFSLDNKQKDYVRTSFFKVIVKIGFQCEIFEKGNSSNNNNNNSELKIVSTINEKISDKFEINVSATLCTSILYVDETDIEFDSCIIGEMYVRDIQVWNRSECPLAFKITPLYGITVDIHQIVSFQEFDSGRIIPFDRIVYVPTFASKRLRVIFRAKDLGLIRIALRLENINNPTNNATITCRINVIDATDNDSLLLEHESGIIIGSGQTLEFGDCYCGLTVARRLWVKNISKDTIILDIISDHPNDIKIDFSGHIADVNPESIKSNLIMQETKTNDTIKDINIHNDNEYKNEDYIDKKFKLKNKHDLEDINGMFDSNERGEYQIKSQKANFIIPKKIKEGLISAQGSAINSKTDLWGEKNNRAILNFVPTFGKNEYYSDDELEGSFEHKRFFIDSTNSFRTEKSIKAEEKEFKTISSPVKKSLKNKSTEQVSNISPLIVPPNSSKPITLIYSPIYKGSNDDDLGPPIDSKRQKYDLLAAGSLRSKSMKLFLSWRIRNSENEEENSTPSHKTDGFKVSKSHTEIYSRLILCKARTCLSLITVSPHVIDLGECSVGDYRTSQFTIVNESDLPSLIFPYVQSETLSVTESDIRIPPRERKNIQLEYVARVENTDYNKKVSLLNACNPESTISFEVRAKNVDTHKVLLHSLFYKLNTHNSKRQLQLYFDTCLTNVQNLKIFSIKNIHSEILKLELIAFGYSEHADTRILLIAPMTKQPIFEPNASSGDQLSRRIEDLKWGSPSVPQVSKRSGSFGQEDDIHLSLSNQNLTTSLNQSKNVSENNSLDNISESIESNHIKRSGSETNLNSAATKVKNVLKEKDIWPHKMNLISQVDKWGFPFSLIKSSIDSKNEDSSRVIDSNISPSNLNNIHTVTGSNTSMSVSETNEAESSSIGTIQKLYREIKDLVEKKEYLIPLHEDGHDGAISIPPGMTYDFAVILEPKSQDVAEELESITLHREIQIRLLSIDSNDLTGYKNSSEIQSSESNEPIKPRILPIRAIVVRSEMVVLQKNISFGKTIVGELSTRGVTVVNKSSVPCIYSISKSGSISSGFLKILSGRKGVVAPMSSHTLEFAFKPTLAGSFEEIVHIENVLHPTNIQSIVVKAKVSKPESFKLLSNSESTSINIPDELHSTMELQTLDLSQRMKLELYEDLNKFEVSEGKSTIATFLGDVHVGESCDVLIAFKIRNVTQKLRQFIVDASHSDAISLLFSESLTSISNINKNIVPFEPIPDTLQSIVTLSCKFLEIAAGDIVQPKLSVQETERQALEDKLEHFQQKLKIAYRKNKPEKIAKYEKKVKDAMAILSGETIDATIAEDDDSGNEAEKKNKQKKVENDVNEENEDKNKSAAINVSRAEDTKTSISNLSVVGESDMAFHISIPAEQEALIQVKITFLPGSSYRNWVGPLPFKGYFRVFECRNEDLIKKVPFGAMLFTRHALSESMLPIINSMVVGRSSFSIGDDNIAALVQNDTIPKESILELEIHQSTFLTTVAQWSSFPTKQIFPRYRQYPHNILGMSLKLVQASKEKIMQGSLSIASLIEGEAIVYLNIINDIKFHIETNIDHEVYNTADHGLMKLTHSVESAGQGELEYIFDTNGKPGWKSKISTGSKLEVNVQWQPPSEIRQRVMITSLLSAHMEVDDKRVGITQYIPIVCFLEYQSNFTVDKNLFFGEVPLGSVLTETITIKNLSEIDEFHYITTLAAATPSARTIGNIDISTGQTGVLSHSSSKEIRVAFSATSVGKFEQELWIWNLRDQFDQKRVVLSATVIVPQSQFVLFPDLDIDKLTGKLKRLDLGLIQIQSNNPNTNENSSNNSYDYMYKLRINNVSDKGLAVTALSNLRSQCFIYTDDKCMHPVVSMPMPPLSETILYVVIRPSSLTSDQSYGRELIGGIRLVFFSISDETQGISEAQDSTNEIVSRKLFETTVVFRATVGCSILRIRSSNSMSQLISTFNYDKTEVKMRTLGTLLLENLSPTFTMSYSHMTTKCEFNSDDKTCSGDFNRLVVFDKKEGILEPNESKEIKYGIVFNCRASGLMRYTIKVLNRNTGDLQTFSSTIFFDNGSITYTPDTAVVSSDFNVSFLGALKPIYVYCMTPSQSTSGRRTVSPANLNIGTFLVTGSEDKILLRYAIQNSDRKSLNITPFSELPITVTIEMVDQQILNVIQTNSTLKREDSRSYSCLLSLSTVSMNMGKFRKCGETVHIPPGEKAIVTVHCNKGSEISDDILPYILPLLDASGIAKLRGAIAFVSSNQMINSLFDPTPHKASVPILSNIFDPPSYSDLELKPPKAPIEVDVDNDLLPFLHYSEIECKFVVPRLLVPSNNLNLGKLRVDRLISFRFPIINSCDVAIPVIVEYLPTWLSIDDKNILIPPKGTYNMQIKVLLPRTDSTVLEEGIIIRNLALSGEDSNFPELSGEDTIHVNIRVEVDAADILELTLANGNVCPKNQKGNHSLDIADVLTIPPSLNTFRSARIYIRNNTNTNVSFIPGFVMNPLFESIIEVDMLNQNSSLIGQSIELIAGEIIECKILCRAFPGTRMPSLLSNDDPVESVNANDVKRFDVLFGTIKICSSIENQKVKESPGSPSKIGDLKNQPSEFMEIETLSVADVADLSIDVSAHLSYGATTALAMVTNSSGHSLIENITFKALRVASSVKQQVDDNDAINDEVWSPHLRLEDDEFKVQLYNPSSTETIAFRISSAAYRHAGMRLSLQKLDEGTYDTIISRAYPSTGAIPPCSSISLSIRLEPCNTQENSIECRQDRDRDQLNFMTVMRMEVNITDDNNPLYPPLALQTLLISDMLLPIIVAQPVSDTNRKKLHLDTYHDGKERLRGKGDSEESRSGSPWESGNLEKECSLLTTHTEDKATSLPKIRLRGVTPCHPMKGQFEICLGQQLQRSESIEWLMTLENCSNSMGMRFHISSLSSNDEKWLLIGQTRGSIPAGGSNSITLYFSRVHLGMFFTYLVLENLTNPQDLHILRVSMEVVNDGKDKQLFAVQTSVNGISWNQSNQKKGNESSHELHQVHYGDVYIGRQYRRRYFILVNLSDTLSLDFQLSSTIGANVVTFTLSPLSLKPCTMVTLAPLERRQVYIVLRPFVPLLYDLADSNNEVASSVDLHSKKIEVERSFSNKLIKGEICISCRLVKDHQETIKIYGIYRWPTLKVSLELQQRIKTRTINSLIDHFIQMSNETNVEVGHGVESIVKLNAGSSRLDKNTRWSHAQHICIGNKDTKERVVTIFSIMQYFSVQIDDVFDKTNQIVTNDAVIFQESEPKQFESEWTLDSIRINSTADNGARMVQNVIVPGEGYLWLSLHANNESDMMNKINNDKEYDSIESITKAKYKMQFLKDNSGEEGEYFMIYLRSNPTEKYRISVRIDPHFDLDAIDPMISTKLLSSTSLIPIHNTNDVNRGSSVKPHQKLIAPLEFAICLYLKQFNAIWSPLFDDEPDGFKDDGIADENLSSITESIYIKTMLKDIYALKDVKVTEEVLCVNPNNIKKRVLALAESSLIFLALTDQLILQRCRQSNHLAASTTNQPATTLAHLLYLMLFRHPVFEIALDLKLRESNAAYEVIIPFCSQFSHYMESFPDMHPDDPLVRLSTTLEKL